ncbi:MAG: hypothetical protein ABJE95_32965 [Byssovorax sp.]
MIPTSFQTLRALKVLNIGAVGLALAGVVGAVLALFFHQASVHPLVAACASLPTLLCGLLWAWMLRRPATVGKTSIRWGWVGSIPLAMINAGLTLAVMISFSTTFDPGRFFLAILLGATFGAMVWIPALLATLACFGLPIASAQRLAKRGLAGEERGEWIVGLVCIVMSLIALGISYQAAPSPALDGGAWPEMHRVLASLGLTLGLAAASLAQARAARRRTFIADTEAGKIPGYRVDALDEGKVLVRIVAQGQGYRVADFEQEIFELDAEGEATRPKHVDER